jgi:hypothetical protein
MKKNARVKISWIIEFPLVLPSSFMIGESTNITMLNRKYSRRVVTSFSDNIAPSPPDYEKKELQKCPLAF